MSPREIKPSVVIVGQGGSHGAGVIWRSDGIVVTNRHVIHDDRVDIVLDDGRKFTGMVTPPATPIVISRWSNCR